MNLELFRAFLFRLQGDGEFGAHLAPAALPRVQRLPEGLRPRKRNYLLDSLE